ncbi:MAG: hypothetical protein R8F63_08135 [Acidimicrobiales bacterium]|nr:hypothetical protein [Acidimicrobiales bacterium]
MTRIGIIGGGRGATLHAEAVRATRGATLSGVGGRPSSEHGGTAAMLADAVGVAEMTLDELVAASDGLVVAVPPAAVGDVVARVPTEMALVVECPAADLGDRPQAMTAANLLHAPAVTRGLRAIEDLGHVHHLVLRGRGPRPTWGAHGTAAWGGGVMLDPHATTLPVLLAAAGSGVSAMTGTVDGPAGLESAVRLRFSLADGREAAAELAWSDDDLLVELEAASDRGVVTIRLMPSPAVELDGRPVAADPDPPLVALGFVAQMDRFAGVVRGERTAWPPLGVGAALRGLAASLPDVRSG